MKRFGSSLAVWFAATVPLLVLTGCTGSGDVAGGDGNVIAQIGAGPTVEGYGFAQMGVAQIAVLPADPVARGVVRNDRQPDPIGLVVRQVSIDLTADRPQTLSALNLSGGIYDIIEARITSVGVNVDPEPPGSDGFACEADPAGGFRPRKSSAIWSGQGELIVPLPAGSRVWVPPAGTGRLLLQVDGTALSQMLKRVQCDQATGAYLGIKPSASDFQDVLTVR